MKRCTKNGRCGYGQLQHLFVDASWLFNVPHQQEEDVWNNFDLMMIFGSCKRWEGSYVVS